MAQKRRKQRGVIKMASGLLLAAFGAMLSLTGCSTDDAGGERLATVSQGVVMCGATICGTGTNDCNLWTCLGTVCLQGKPQKAPGDACTAVGKNGVNPPGRCALDSTGKEFGCCTGCLEETGRDIFTCHTIAEEDVRICGAAGADCAACEPTNCGEPLDCVKGACTYTPTPDDKPCADGSGVCYKGSCCSGCIDAQGNCQAGTAPDVCGVSVAGSAHADCKSCLDTDVCTTDICKEGTCAHGKTADNTPCADGNQCDGAESCQGGVCKEPAGFKCPADSNVCHAPSCDANMRCSQQLLTGTDCPDANLCNGTEKCNNGVCNGAGTPKNCNDNNPCTFDDCDPKTGACLNTPLAGGESCENGDVCDGIGFCNDSAKCVVEPAQACDNSDPCKVFTCDKTKGCVVSSFTTAACNDGDPCTTVDKCNGAGVCQGGTPLKCDDGNGCTSDSCLKGQGCTAVAANEGGMCDDGNDCSTGDKCVAGKCKSSGGKTCPDDANPCTTASCDPGNQVCGQANDNALKCQTDKCHQFTQCTNGTCPAGALIDCNDNNPCTTDDCDPATGCTHDADDAATCTDNELCTADACSDGECVSTPLVCEAVDDCHKVGSCNDKTGFCDAPRADVGTACEDDTGKCDDKGKCSPNPVTGEGGAGGEPTGTAGDGAGGTAVAEGGTGTVTPVGGEGNEPAMGGEPGTVGSGGKAGKSGGGSASHEGGAADIPEHVFVRTPGGCSCAVPSSPRSNLAWLGGLALIGAVLARRRRAGQGGAAASARLS